MTGEKYGTDEKRMKHFTKCTFCGKCDNVQYLAGLEWFLIRDVITITGIKMIIHDLYKSK